MIQVSVCHGTSLLVLGIGLLMLICTRWAESFRAPYTKEDEDRQDSRDYRQDSDHHRDLRYQDRQDSRDYRQDTDQHRDLRYQDRQDSGDNRQDSDHHRDLRYQDRQDSEDYRQDTDQHRDLRRTECRRCCDPGEEPQQYGSPYPQYQVVPQINITILKGEKGEYGQRGQYGKAGKTGQMGPKGPHGLKGAKGNIGPQGNACKSYYAAFSVGRKKALHSVDYYQTLVFDTELVNLYGHFNMFTGKFFCYVPGIYFFSLNVHTWNQKETYLHVMRNEQEAAILYAQPSDRSIMQSQSLMLELERDDEVWVRLYKGERENAVFSDDFDTYITFNGHLIKAKSEG